MDRRAFLTGGLATVGALVLGNEAHAGAQPVTEIDRLYYQLFYGHMRYVETLHIANLIAPEIYQRPVYQETIDSIMDQIVVDRVNPYLLVNTSGVLLTRKSVESWYVAKDIAGLRTLPAYMFYGTKDGVMSIEDWVKTGAAERYRVRY